MVVNFSNLDLKEKPTLVLKNLDGTAIQTLGYAFNVEVELCYNEVSTLSFDLPAQANGSPTPHYSDVIGMRIIDLVGVGQFILIDPSEIDEGVNKIKSCKAYSLEYSLSKKNMFLEAGTFNFYSGRTTDRNTIVGAIAELVPDWSWNVSGSLMNKYRTFEDTNDNIYDFIKNKIQETYGCIFDFDTYTKTINVIDVESIIPTKQVYLSPERLIQKVRIDEDTDNIVTCLSVSGADDVSIRSVNPTGKDEIYNLSHFLNTTNLSQSTINAWNNWVTLCDSYRDTYYNITMEYNLKLMQILTEEAALSNIEIEYTAKDNVRAVVVAGISSGIYSQTDLNTVNSELSAIQTRIDNQKTHIQSLKTQAATLKQSLEDINEILDLDNPSNFTSEQISSLRKYFIDGSLQDSTFVMSSVDMYSNEDLSSSISNGVLTVSNIIEDNYSEAVMTGHNIVHFTGGNLGISTLSAKVISGTVQYVPNTSGECIFSARLENGYVGAAEFESGSITISGTARFSKSVIHGTGSASDIYTIKLTISSGNLYFTKNTSEYEQHEVEWDLYKYGQQVLAEKCVPAYNFSVDSGNFLRLDDYISFHNEFELGKRVYLNLGDNVYQPYVISTKIDFEDMANFSITFSSTYSDFDSSFALSKLLNKSVSMGKTLDINSSVYSEFVSSGAPERLKSIINDALDLAKNSVMSSGEQAVSFDDAGLKLRKWSDQSRTAYDPKQIWAVNNVIAFTKDNWATAEMAIGEVFDKNLGTYMPVSSDATYESDRRYYQRSGTSPNYVYTLYTYNPTTWATDKLSLYQRTGSTEYGIVAPYIVGTLLAGQNLIIDTPNGNFKVDESGVYIDSLKFYITHGGSSYDTTLGEKLDEIDDKIENVTVTYRQSTVPDSPNAGDLWYCTANIEDTYKQGKLYRYNGTSWDELTDSEIAALSTEVETLDTKLSSILTQQGYVDASQISGIIGSSIQASMQSSAGNVLFDTDGIWLMDNATKSTATKAIWMNEDGILFGSGSPTSDPGDPDSGWNWTTAISSEGIVAESIIAGTLSGHDIVGGTISIGARGTTPQSYNFTVDSSGNVVANNLTANNGTFSGTVKATSGLYLGTNSLSSLVNTNSKGETKTSIDSDYLNLKGLTVKNGNTTTMSIDGSTGVVTLGSGTVFSWGSYTTLQEAFNAIDGVASDAADDVYNLARGQYTEAGSTFISGKNIYSPSIYSNLFTVTPTTTTGVGGGIEINGRGTGMETGDYSTIFKITSINYGEGVAAEITADSPGYVYWNLGRTDFSGTVDFSSATVLGISSVATFG